MHETRRLSTRRRLIARGTRGGCLSRGADRVTLTSNDAGHGICGDSPLFDEAPLRAIPELLHDALSQLEFGQGHEHDLLAWVDSTCKGTMLVVVSLLSNGAVEVRLFKPAPDLPPMTDQADLAGFGLFYLQRHQDGCGF